MYYGADRRRVLLDQMEHVPSSCFVSQACRKRTFDPIFSATFKLISVIRLMRITSERQQAPR